MPQLSLYLDQERINKLSAGFNDLVIAATVTSNGGILITNNTKEFSRVNGLLLEDWTKI